MKETLKQAIAASLAQQTGLAAVEIEALLEAPKKAEFGDVAFPCFQLAKSRQKKPVEIAAEMAQTLPLPQGIEKITADGPFLNFRFRRSAIISSTVSAILNDREKFGSASRRKETVVIEYSSPNIAKPFHVGHLRATLIGNSLDRIYRFRGYNTVSINHIGDWGTQFGFVWAGCKLWGKPTEPTVSALVELYRRATKLKEEQEKIPTSPEHAALPDVNEIARGFFRDLEEGKDYSVEFWQWCLDISLKYLKETYQRLDVSFDHYLGESFYSDRLEGVKLELASAGILVESQGALGVDLGEPLGFARILTPDG